MKLFVKGVGWVYLVDGNDPVCGLRDPGYCLRGHGCSFECAIDSLLLWERGELVVLRWIVVGSWTSFV